MGRLFSLFRWLPFGGDPNPDLDEFTEIGIKMLAELPEPFRGLSSEIIINAAEFPDDQVLAALDLGSPYDLLGLFTGTGLAEDGGQSYTGRPANQIWLYRQPILAYWEESDDSLERIIAHVLIHEIGHHFGLSDADMARIEGMAE